LGPLLPAGSPVERETRELSLLDELNAEKDG